MIDQRRIDILTSQNPPQCPRCGEEGLLSARVPHGWLNASGGQVQGRCGVVLCAWCDAAGPHGAPLITWFHVHGQVEQESSPEFMRLLLAWAENAEVAPLDERALAEEVEAWRRGEL